MKRKLVSVLSLAVLSTTFLAACGNEASQGSSDTSKGSAAPQPSSNVSQSSIKDGVIPASDPSKNPAAAKNRKDTIVSGISTPEGVFLPHFFHNGWDENVTNVMFADLINFDKTGKPIPELAEKWDISADQLTYTFHLKPNLKYSDGSPVTADDVAFTLTILHDKSYDGETDISLAHIKGGQAYKDGKATTIEGIKVIDPLTIQVTTDEVSAVTLPLLGGPVLSKAYYGKDYKQGQLEYLRALYGKPMGAGPYKFEKFVPGQEVRFVANENYFQGKPSVEHFIYKVTTADTKLQLLKTGETDYDGLSPANSDNFEALKALGFADINLYTSSDYAFVEYNVKKPYLADKKVRQALIYGLDRKTIVDTYFQGFGSVANEPIAPVSWAYTDDVNQYEYNLNKAKQLLDEAGWKVGSDGIREKDGQKLKLSFLATKTNKINDILIPVAKENFKDLGVSFEPELLDFNALLAKRKKGDYDLVQISTSSMVEPNDGVNDFSSTAPGNYSGYSNAKVDELIKKGLSTLDIEKRKPVYKDLYKEISDDPPVIFMYNRKIMSATNSRVKGLDYLSAFTGITNGLSKLKIE